MLMGPHHSPFWWKPTPNSQPPTPHAGGKWARFPVQVVVLNSLTIPETQSPAFPYPDWALACCPVLLSSPVVCKRLALGFIRLCTQPLWHNCSDQWLISWTLFSPYLSKRVIINGHAAQAPGRCHWQAVSYELRASIWQPWRRDN